MYFLIKKGYWSYVSLVTLFNETPVSKNMDCEIKTSHKSHLNTLNIALYCKTQERNQNLITGPKKNPKKTTSTPSNNIYLVFLV